MTDTLPATFYVDADTYERERLKVFGQEWLILGRTAELRDTGGYIAEEIAGYPVFVAVDSGGIPWAYHNVCPHRAGPILLPGRGHTDELVCQYHGWCFSYQGSLIEARDFGEDAEFDPTGARLREISMANWGGMMWVNLAGEAQPLEETLQPMAADCSDIAFDELQHTGHVTMAMKCNWKLVVDNFLEDYHVARNHPVLVSHFNMDTAVAHGSDAYTVQETQTRDGRRMRWFYRFPNVVLQVLDSTLCWMQILPQSPNSTLLVFDYYAPPGTDDAPLKELCTQLVEQDRAVCEMVQKNLEAGVFNTGHLGARHEASLMWFRHKIVSAIGHGPTA